MHPAVRPFFLLALLAAGLVSAVARPGRAARNPICLSVTSEVDAIPQDELARMARSILAHHPAFPVVEDHCDTTLEIDLFLFSGTLQLTIRARGEVPLRYSCRDGADVKYRLEQGIPEVLRSAPVYLQKNISQYSRAERARHAVVVTGHNIFRLELMQAAVRGEHGVSFAPGAAFGFTRGSRRIRVGARVHAVGAKETEAEGDSRLRLGVGLDAGATFEFNENRPVSGYVGGGAGLSFLRFEGRIDSNAYATNDVLFQVFARIGVRMLRLTDFDLDLFACGYLPVHPVRDPESPMFGDNHITFTPSVQMGIGVGF